MVPFVQVSHLCQHSPLDPVNLEETQVRFLSKTVKYVFLLGLLLRK